MSDNLLPHDGSALYFPNAITDDLFLTRLLDEVDWVQEELNVFGRKLVPRLTAYYGTFPYRYSGTDHPARELPEVLTAIQQGIAATQKAHCNTELNSVLCNQYRDGNDSMGWHRDNEPEIDPTCIASVSFGGTRRFKLRHRESREVVDLELESGSLLLMLDCQNEWEHCLPKTKQPAAPRVNLTFRSVRSK